MLYIILFLLYFVSPIGINWLVHNYAVINKVGAVLMAYFWGIFIAFVLWRMNEAGMISLNTEEAILGFQNIVVSGVILFAIPMLLFSSNYTNLGSLMSKALRVTLAGIVATASVVVLAALAFSEVIGDEMWKIAGLVAGVETGGTPNMAALQLVFKARPSTYTLLNLADMIVCFIYILFLMSAGPRFFRSYLLPYKHNEIDTQAGEGASSPEVEESPLFDWSGHSFLGVLKAILVSLGIVVLSALLVALGYLLFTQASLASLGALLKQIADGGVPFVMLALTSLSIVASLSKPIRTIPYAFDTGMYIVMIFSIGIASMIQFNDLFNTALLGVAGFLAFSIFGSLLVHSLLCKLLKIDADTFMVSSSALVNSPPFVPMIAGAIGNKKVIVIGMTVGILGYAVGNYLGMGVAYFLKGIL